MYVNNSKGSSTASRVHYFLPKAQGLSIVDPPPPLPTPHTSAHTNSGSYYCLVPIHPLRFRRRFLIMTCAKSMGEALTKRLSAVVTPGRSRIRDHCPIIWSSVPSVVSPRLLQRVRASSSAVFEVRHCPTCHSEIADCGVAPLDELPPPLPEPAYSVRRRLLPENLVALHSQEGRERLTRALLASTSKPYLHWMEHFTNQSDPAYCGITTLLIVLNVFAVDPHVRWKGGWRYFGHEDVLLQSCPCVSSERVRRVGVTMVEWARLAQCQGVDVRLERCDNRDLSAFRTDVKLCLDGDGPLDSLMVTSFGRSALGQTGDGHFSPIAAYEETTDSVLVLDVARFKYSPYWVAVEELWKAMEAVDQVTEASRGWFVLRPPKQSASYRGVEIVDEERRPATVVPTTSDSPSCPVHAIKVEFCQNNKP